jgi:hypothetical protein
MNILMIEYSSSDSLQDQVKNSNMLVYWSENDNKLMPLTKGTQFAAFEGARYCISNGNTAPQKISIDFDINMSDPLQTDYIIARINFSKNFHATQGDFISDKSIWIFNPPTKRYKGTANYILNQFDLIEIFVQFDSSNTTTINITVNSIGEDDIRPKIPATNNWYLIIFLFFIIFLLLAFYFWRKHHFHTLHPDAKKV